jgi:cytochrome c biogenesis protein CcmG/thiol:disulfide interchange protein DsbE
MKWRLWLPLLGFAMVAGLLYFGLDKDPRKLASPLIDRPAPVFEVPQLGAAGERFSPQKMRGQVWLLNVWASWCVTCRDEHPVLLKLARAGSVPIIGLNHKDQDDAARRWLERFGDPYRLSAVDADGRVSIDYGVYGVPETFVIDRNGFIRHKFIGALTEQALQDEILPAVRRWQ